MTDTDWIIVQPSAPIPDPPEGMEVEVQVWSLSGLAGEGFSYPCDYNYRKYLERFRRYRFKGKLDADPDWEFYYNQKYKALQEAKQRIKELEKEEDQLHCKFIQERNKTHKLNDYIKELKGKKEVFLGQTAEWWANKCDELEEKLAKEKDLTIYWRNKFHGTK